MTTRRNFTLLEICIAIAVIAIASSLITVKMFYAVEKKQFHSHLERLQSQFLTCQKMAIAMQADWRGVLKKGAGGWTYSAFCEEETIRKLSPLQLGAIEIFFNQKKFEEMGIDFFASGEVAPEGSLLFVFKGETIEWDLPGFFQRIKSNSKHPP